MQFLDLSLRSLQFMKRVPLSDRWRQRDYREPWYTWPFIDFISPRLQPGFRILEYGSGSSTLWFAEKSFQVCSVESDIKYFSCIYDKQHPKVEIQLRSAFLEAYENCKFNSCSEFDIISIDGVRRYQCSVSALDKISSDGVIILDDSHRENYGEIIELLCSKNFKELRFSGIKRLVPFITSTSVFYRKQNCLYI